MTPPIAIVAGSGIDLLPVLDAQVETVPFSVAGIPCGCVEGHAHRFHLGNRLGREVIVQCGRLHAYEGFGYAEITAPVRWLMAKGVTRILFTNAVGALRAESGPGDLLAIDALVPWPYRGFALPELLHTTFAVPGCDGAGAYLWVHGPCYETRSEIDAMHSTGAVAVGMSTAPELHATVEGGLDAGVVSCVTNNCLVPQRLTHAHVIQTAARTSSRLCGMLGDWIDRA